MNPRESRICIVALIMGLAMGLASPAAAQTPINYWLNPNGGFWSDPTSWADGTVPGPTTTAYLILPNSYTIFAADGVDVLGLLAEQGEVEVRTNPSNPVSISELLQITTPLGSVVSTRLGFLGNGFSLLESVQVGGTNAGAELGIGVGHEALTRQLRVEPFSNLSFQVNESSPSLCPSSITLLEDAEIDGGFVLTGRQGFLRPGDTFNLIDASLSGTGVVMPEFGLVVAIPGTEAEVIIEEGPAGRLDALAAKATEATSVGRLEAIQGAVLSATPFDVLFFDADGDGDDDVLLAMNDGKHQVFLRVPGPEYVFDRFIETFPDVRAAAVGDFNDDGYDDLAFASAVDTTGQGIIESFLQLRLFGENYLDGPSEIASDLPISLAYTRIPTAALFTDSGGVTLTTKEASSGRGTARGYDTSDTDIVKTGEVEVGDDPGPSDPIDDEKKKDPEAPIGVGGSTTALVSMPVLNVLDPTPDGYEIERVIPTSGRVVAFDSADIDGDGRIETLVLTDSNRMDLLRPLEASQVFGSVPLGPGTAVGVTIGELGGDGRLEVLVLFDEADGTSRLDLYRADVMDLLAPMTGSRRRPYLQRQDSISSPQGAVAGGFNASTGGLVPVSGALPNGMPLLQVFEYTRQSISGCSVADLDGDGNVDANDLSRLIAAWGACIGCPEDLDGDGRVGPGDLGIMFSNWGPC